MKKGIWGQYTGKYVQDDKQRFVFLSFGRGYEIWFDEETAVEYIVEATGKILGECPCQEDKML